MSAPELLRLESIPVYQNKMFPSATSARACARGDVLLVQDAASGLIYNAAFDPDRLSYDPSYQNEQGHSAAFRTHIAAVMRIVSRHFSGGEILEIGCGKGAFLDELLAAGHRARGIDPAYEGHSPHIVRENFAPGLGIRADAIIMRHVLEHIPAPIEFLNRVRAANGPGARIYIEVPCFDWILERRAWFDVFYEHVNYFRARDFARSFSRVLESGLLFGGQYLYVVAELDSLRDPGTQREPTDIAELPADFFGSLERCLARAQGDAKKVIWGAAAKGVMFAHHLGRRGVSLSLAIDINPAKQGCYLAGSGLPVLAPAQALAQLGRAPDIFVMNSNYLDEIMVQGGPHPNYVVVDRND